MAKKVKKRALGRGIASLIPHMEPLDNEASDYFQCDINAIVPNRYQPRQHFSKDALKELSISISEQGILQPLLVRKIDSGYELIAGERRLRASKLAELSHLPVIVRETTDKEMLEISIVENIQRQNLNPMEEAEGYQRLAAEFNLTQDEIAIRVGKSRSAVTNYIRLLKLPRQVKESISKKSISMGHARALLGVDDAETQIRAWQLIISKGLSVRETEALVKQLKGTKPQPSPPEHDTHDYSSFAKNMSTYFNTRVSITRKGQNGKLEISFKSDEELERLLNLIKTEQ